MKIRTRATMGAVLVLPALLVGCGNVGEARSLQEDNDKAKQALREAKSVSFALRVNDPDGALRRALEKTEPGQEPPPAKLLDALLSGSIAIRSSAAGDGKALDYNAACAKPIEEQLKAGNVEFLVKGDGADLAQMRVVEGVAYATSDIAKIDELLAAGGQKPIAAGLDGAPPAVAQAVTDMRAGKWVKLPLAKYAPQISELQKQAGAAGAPTQADACKALADLQNAIKPHVQLSDLGADGDVRRATVRVGVKQALRAAATTFGQLGGGPELGPAQIDKLLEGVSDAPVEGRLTIEDGHYKSLSVPLRNLAALDTTPSPDVPDFGASELVIDINDDAGAVTAPEQLSAANLEELVDGFFAQLKQAQAGGARRKAAA